MAKQFYFYFGSGLPGSYTGLSPTFVIFNVGGISAAPAPGITEFVSSGATGIYGFQYGITASVAFVIDGGATLTSANIRYITGSIDPVMSVDQTIGYAPSTTLGPTTALGYADRVNNAIGYTTDSFGSTLSDPVSVMGYAKRHLEFNEGNMVFTKATGTWDIYSRGSSTLLREKALSNTTSSATRS